MDILMKFTYFILKMKIDKICQAKESQVIKSICFLDKRAKAYLYPMVETKKKLVN